MVEASGVAKGRGDRFELEDHLGEPAGGQRRPHARDRARVVVGVVGAPVTHRTAHHARALKGHCPAAQAARKVATSASSVQFRPPIIVRVNEALARWDLID